MLELSHFKVSKPAEVLTKIPSKSRYPQFKKSSLNEENKVKFKAL